MSRAGGRGFGKGGNKKRKSETFFLVPAFTLISFQVPVTVITGQLGSGKNDDK